MCMCNASLWAYLCQRGGHYEHCLTTQATTKVWGREGQGKVGNLSARSYMWIHTDKYRWMNVAQFYRIVYQESCFE